MLDSEKQARFERLVLPHLDAAFNLARWLLRSRTDAEDAAQEAVLRSYRFFPGFHREDARAWLLKIVRNACYTWMQKNLPGDSMSEFHEELYRAANRTPEELAIAGEDRVRFSRALQSLSPRAIEILVLRELEGCPYKESLPSPPFRLARSCLPFHALAANSFRRS